MRSQWVLKRERQSESRAKKRARGIECEGWGVKNLWALFWLVRFLNKQTSRQRPCSTNRLSIHLGQNLICWGLSQRPDDRETERSNGGGGGRLQPSLAMHKTKCWHKVTQHAEQGRQEESIPPSLHLSIDIPGSPLPASGFCNYHQTAASRPPKPLTDGLD